MRRLPKVLFFTGLLTLAGTWLAPFQDYAIEGTPDGKSLGLISAGDFRSVSLVIVSIPLLALAAFILLSKRFGSRQRLWAIATLSLIGISWLLQAAVSLA